MSRNDAMTMRKAIAAGKKEVRIVDEPLSEPGVDEILIRGTVSGVSVGTEMALYKATICNLSNDRWGYWNEYPIDLGYELAGIVEKKGAEVRDVKEGDRVMTMAPHGTRALVPPFRYVKIPDNVTDEDATLAVLATTTTHGIRRAGVEYGERVLVLGMGVVGILSGLHAKRSGAGEVYVADPLAWKREFVERYDFQGILDPLDGRFEERVFDLTGGFGMDLVIEASGHPSAFEPAFRAVKKGGRILIQGTHTTPVSVNFSDYVLHKQLRLIGTWTIGNTMPLDPHYNRWNRRNNIGLAMDLIARGELPVGDFVTHRFPFDEITAVFGKLEKGELQYLQIILEY